jgi:hypothetical protein
VSPPPLLTLTSAAFALEAILLRHPVERDLCVAIGERIDRARTWNMVPGLRYLGAIASDLAQDPVLREASSELLALRLQIAERIEQMRRDGAR